MAITDGENGNGFYMPVAPAYGGGYGNNNGLGGDGWLVLLLLLAMNGGRGFGGMGGSYARDGRGRGSNAKRDSMGRYSSRMDGYSRHGDVVESLREVMEEAPDDRTRMEIQRLIEKMEQR